MRKVACCGARALEGEHVSDKEVRKELRIVHPEAACCADRLRLFGRIVAHAPPDLRTLLRTKGGQLWRQDLVKDLGVMAIMLQGKLDELGDPLCCPAKWEAFVAEHPRPWKQLVKAFLKAASDESAFVAACARVGIDVFVAQQQVQEEEEWMCGLCGACFVDRKRLAVHQAQKHKVADPLRCRVGVTRCPFCSIEFWSRWRLRAHLRSGAEACTARVEELPFLQPEVVEALDKEERELFKTARKKGANPVAGPPCLLWR